MQRLVITGPTGWIGQALLAQIARRQTAGLACQVTAFGSTAREVALPSGGHLAIRALDSIRPADVAGAHVIHLAYLTKDKAEELGERRFCDTNLAIDEAVLAALEGGPASLFVASSGAAKLAAQGADLHPYGLAKLRQEARFLEWGRSAGVPVLAGRIFNLAGPYINKLQSYAISDFALQALQSQTIAIAAQIPVFRSFLHVDDLCRLMLDTGLQRIGRDLPIDLCGSEVLEMADIARAISEQLGGGIAIERSLVAVDRVSTYLGHFPDTKALALQAGVELSDTKTCIKATLDWLRIVSAEK